MQFEGNRQIGAAVLMKAVSEILVGREYSERDTRRVFDLNLRPIYEEKRLLTVAFGRMVSAKSGAGAR